MKECDFMGSFRQKILIVDDSQVMTKMLEAILKNDYDIIIATSGEQCLKIALREIPDLILLDVLMEGLDGYEVCRKLKSDAITMDIPVIFITGLDETNDERKGLEVGAIDYITKPFSEPIVKIRVKNHLELKRNRDLLKELSSIDDLTGIFNRRQFDQAYTKEWQKALISRTYISLAMIDIDFFKAYNDYYGHLRGDECLKSIATVMQNIERSKGSVYRYGGEEFVYLMPDTDLNTANNITFKISQGINSLNIPHEKSSVAEHVTISAGVGTIIPTNNIKPFDFLNMVDNALYKSKRLGRNQIQLTNIELVNTN